MSGEALLDVNVLVALFDPDHVHHDLAHDWFTDKREAGWATCPVTEAGFIRVLSNPAYGSLVVRPGELAARLTKFCASGNHRFWRDGVSLRDGRLFNLSVVAGYRQITDIYLLGLALKMGGRLATFDGRIPLAAVIGANRSTLDVIAPAEP
jgi:toxin-antitoxin system PIN domain toxin